MGENESIWYRIDNNNLSYYTISNDGWATATLSTNYNTGYNVDDKISKLENEIKELRKTIARLSTMVCTHIGQEQLKNFNNGQ